ncbi:MAG: hypothetical protein ACIWVG_06225, partial [Gloeotrichia echinulata HAB0833]
TNPPNVGFRSRGLFKHPLTSTLSIFTKSKTKRCNHCKTVVLVFEQYRKSVTWKKYLPKNHDFCRIRKAEFLILDKVELTARKTTLIVKYDYNY